VFHHDHSYGEGGTYEIEFGTKKFGKKSVSYKRGEKREFEIRFREPATLAVTVRGFAGSEHADKIELGLVRREGEGDTKKTAPDAEGRAVLGPVESGDYDVVLFVRCGRHQSIGAVKKPVSLPAGESEATLAIPPLHELVIAGNKGEQYHITADENFGGWFYESRTCGDDGRATFGPLPAGRYTLRADGKPGDMTVSVPCGEVTYRASEYNALKVSIQDPDGALAKAGLQDGDLVVAVNGTEFKGAAQMQLLFAGAMGRGDAKLTLVRGSRTVELTINLKDVMQGGVKPGGSVRPVAR
jgi:hypothetical protein